MARINVYYNKCIYINVHMLYRHSPSFTNLENCIWAEWLSWTSCTSTCTGGEQTRKRKIKANETIDSTPCYKGRCYPPLGKKDCHKKDCSLSRRNQWDLRISQVFLAASTSLRPQRQRGEGDSHFYQFSSESTRV